MIDKIITFVQMKRIEMQFCENATRETIKLILSFRASSSEFAIDAENKLRDMALRGGTAGKITHRVIKETGFQFTAC